FWSYFFNIIGDIHFFLPGVFANNTTDVVNSNLWTLPWELQCYIFMSTALIYASFVDGFQIVPAQVGGPTLVYYFVAGVLMFLWRDKFVFHEVFFFIASAACYILMMSPKTVFIYPVLLTYITVFIGLFPFPRFPLIKSGDYSYGIYLYGFPVTQSLVAGFAGLHQNL